MPRPEEELIAILKKNGVDFTASLPCEKIKTLLEMVGRVLSHLPLTREEEGVGICAGAALCRQTACHVRPELGHREHDQCPAVAHAVL